MSAAAPVRMCAGVRMWRFAIGRTIASEATDPAANAATCSSAEPPPSATSAARTAASESGPRNSPRVSISPAASPAATSVQITQSGTERSYPEKGPGLARGQFEAALDIREQVLGRLAADAEAHEPLGHVVPAPARAALRARPHAPEAGRLRHQPAVREEALRAPPALEREADDRAEAAHLPEGDLVGGVVRKARIAHGAHVVAEQQPLGQRQGVRALPLQSQLERPKRTVCEPGLERPGDRAGLRAPRDETLGQLRGADRDVAEDEVAVPAQMLGDARHAEVCPELQRELAERSGQRVVHR